VLGIVGSGLDVVYPPGHGELWDRVATVGVLVSEAPPGARPERWRFPARNRLIAAAAHAVVVVESHARGGALLTVDEALTRDRPVLAVPGPVTSPASAGTNHLLGEGAAPCTSVDDVLVTIGAEVVAHAPTSVGPRAGASRPEPSPVGAAVLDALGWEPASLAVLAERLPWPLGEVAAALDVLGRDGHVTEADGWYERAAEP
jgi:DNA processing protein